MKTFFLNLVMVFLIAFSACSVEETILSPDTDDEKLIGKWDVSDSQANYGSFEFCKDKKYIIQ